MAIYKAPVRDMQFVLHDMLNVEQQFSELGYDESNRELVDTILSEAGKLFEEVVFPTNKTGDEEGCRFDNGEVRTPAGFKEAYKAMSEGGWTSLACDPEYGGQGLPQLMGFVVEEMMGSANMALSLYPGLTRGAYMAMQGAASEELKRTYLPNMVSGQWTGTMCLTEPHCGTDLGMVRTKAVPQDDGSYKLSGTKIFITGGQQDLTENIIHLVLARLPDSPTGSKGISLFLVPKILLNEDGSLGERNGVVCSSIEHKMGIKGSATCMLNFEEATGYLVGEPHQGLRAMFLMMNHERLAVGVQGLSLGEVAYQSAVAYARERLQGRSLSGAKAPDQAADPIIVHPDVRRMLLTAKAYNEGARALAAWLGLKIDIAHSHSDPQVREEAADLVALMTPVIKAFFTDTGSEVCNLCLQVFGGHGYIQEWGMEQLVRDARIAQIYEGTNGVQAMDLVGRKLAMHDGRLVMRYFAAVQGFIDENKGNNELAEFIVPLQDALDKLKGATQWLAEEAKQDPEVVGAVATDYLRLTALVSYAHMWAWMAKAALPKVDADDGDFYQAKLSTARFYTKRLLPQCDSLLGSIKSGSKPLMEMAAEAF